MTRDQLLKNVEVIRDPFGFTLDVDRNMSIEKLVEAGAYDVLSGELWDFLTPKKRGLPRPPVIPPGGIRGSPIEIGLARFSQSVSPQEALPILKNNGLLPADKFEGLTFGMMCPGLQMQFPIVISGDTFQKTGETARSVLCLSGHEDKRRLRIFPYDMRMRVDCRILIIVPEAA